MMPSLAETLFAGHHEDVNLPTDDAEKLDYDKAWHVATLACALTRELATRRELWGPPPAHVVTEEN